MATSWTDPSLVAGSTPIKATHILQLKTALIAERLRRKLTQFTLPAPEPAVDVIIDDGHLVTIRNNISNFAPLSVGESIVGGVTIIKKSHIDELRAKINALENHPVVGGSTDCNSSCTGLCVGCSSSCTGGCSGCSGSCSGGCSGGCSGCSGCGVSCSGSCSGGCLGCSGSCSGYCAGGCSGCGGF